MHFTSQSIISFSSFASSFRSFTCFSSNFLSFTSKCSLISDISLFTKPSEKLIKFLHSVPICTKVFSFVFKTRSSCFNTSILRYTCNIFFHTLKETFSAIGNPFFFLSETFIFIGRFFSCLICDLFLFRQQNLPSVKKNMIFISNFPSSILWFCGDVGMMLAQLESKQPWTRSVNILSGHQIWPVCHHKKGKSHEWQKCRIFFLCYCSIIGKQHNLPLW